MFVHPGNMPRLASVRNKSQPNHLKDFLTEKVDTVVAVFSPKAKMARGNSSPDADASVNISDENKIKMLEELVRARDKEILKLRKEIDKLEKMKKCSVKLD